jgi:putative ABC transport system substrate-binding protein
MRRRKFITLVSGAAVMWPLTARAQRRAQQVALPVVGLLGSVSVGRRSRSAFSGGLSEQGYIEGRDVRIEYRSADGQYDRLPGQAAELVSLPVNVIAAVGSSPAAIAAKAATSTIPIVFLVGVDPVEIGLVASFNSPGGNVTGVCAWQETMTPKILELLNELLPKSELFAFLINPNNPAANKEADRARKASDSLGHDLIVVRAGTEGEIDQAFETLAQQRVGGLVVDQEALFGQQSDQIAALGLHWKLPTLFANRSFTAAGGLVSYSADYLELLRQVGIYVGKILNGASPANLPVLQPTKYELVVNLKTARALGLNIPPAILARADQVLE